eukprot:TRINITY_DN88041_c0_g1_i1.p1 TRINITY_DN88041_c0_g1~~TRINITY_DN88041_c0_g1_i1.p1  ORF type:complete len:696 (+),score=208.26 TRINITY_DN88041_c0_g1_i1:220-2307(+)
MNKKLYDFASPYPDLETMFKSYKPDLAEATSLSDDFVSVFSDPVGFQCLRRYMMSMKVGKLMSFFMDSEAFHKLTDSKHRAECGDCILAVYQQVFFPKRRGGQVINEKPHFSSTTGLDSRIRLAAKDQGISGLRDGPCVAEPYIDAPTVCFRHDGNKSVKAMFVIPDKAGTGTIKLHTIDVLERNVLLEEFWKKACKSAHDPSVKVDKVFYYVEAVLLAKIFCDYYPGFLRSSYWKELCFLKQAIKHSIKRGIDEDCFELLSQIGRGGFADVWAVRKIDTGRMYAVKCQDKRVLAAKGALKVLKSERDIMSKLKSPFCTSLKYAFETDQESFIVMDILDGGDFWHLIRVRKHLPENNVRYIAAELVLALEYLHNNGIIFRDLKPENILMDYEQHIRLADFGLAVQTNGKPIRGKAGTPGYWAPEVIMRDEQGLRMAYNQSADWWSFACCLFTMLAGYCPFHTANTANEKDHSEVERNTLRGIISWPDIISPVAKDFLSQFFIMNPKKRLGYLLSDIAKIKAHPFFDGVDWGLVALRAISPVSKQFHTPVKNATGNFSPKNNFSFENLKIVGKWESELLMTEKNDFLLMQEEEKNKKKNKNKNGKNIKSEDVMNPLHPEALANRQHGQIDKDAFPPTPAHMKKRKIEDDHFIFVSEAVISGEVVENLMNRTDLTPILPHAKHSTGDFESPACCSIM